jgi:cardiolipin synthase
MELSFNKNAQKIDHSKPQPVGTEYGWDSEGIYSSAKLYFDGLLNDIDSAESSIELVVYIFSLDRIGLRVTDALFNASQRGVKVRLVIDGVGSAVDAESIARRLSGAGAEVRIYHPLPWYWGNYRWSLTPGGGFEKLYYFIAAINRRDHRKFCVIDNSIAWCGSFNICQDHLSETIPWRDYGVRLTGDAVSSLVDTFDSVWFGRKNQKLSIKVSRFFRSNYSLRLRRLSNQLLVFKIRNAKQRVWICSAYFSPSGSVIKALRVAKSRKVDVRLIVAGRSDITLFPILSSTYYADLLKIGVSIYRYQAGILHAKAMLVDKHCLIGSTNLNHRSFHHDLELDVVLSMPESIERIKILLEQDMQKSLQLSQENVMLWGRFMPFGWILRMLRYWL